jgi:hypothetical protein
MRLRLSLALLVLLLVPAATAMASGRDVLRDCADDEALSKPYTQKEYRDALSKLATDNSEYSDCERVIRAAQLEQASGGGRKKDDGGGTATTGGGATGGGGSTGSTGSDEPAQPAVPRTRGSDPLAALDFDERVALDEARTGGGKGIAGADGVVPPGSSRAPDLTGSSPLPGPITGLLILLAGALVLVTAARLRTRVLGRRTA